MPIRYPKHCKTKAEKSAHARYVASVRWAKARAGKPQPAWIGYIEFGGPLAADCPMRLDLYAVEGERKWTAVSERQILPQRLSIRAILRLVKAILMAPREGVQCGLRTHWIEDSGCTAPAVQKTPGENALQSPTGSGGYMDTENGRSGFCHGLRIPGEAHSNGRFTA